MATRRTNEELRNLLFAADKDRQKAVDELNLTKKVFADFKDTVREIAINTSEEQGWCDSGLNETLEELGLRPKNTPGTVVNVLLTMFIPDGRTYFMDAIRDGEFAHTIIIDDAYGNEAGEAVHSELVSLNEVTS